MRSIIRWAGSKRLLVDRLRQGWPQDAKRYVEPFAGSASLFFALEPQEALLTDLNVDLITTYQAVRRDSSRVLECLRRMPSGSEAYYKVRAQSPTGLSSPERAARFLYLNRRCFNGLYRTNASGQFNVPYGPPKKPLQHFEESVLAAATQLRRATIRAQDFSRTVAEVRKGDFVYMDPPYAVDDRRIFREYLPGSFSRDDLERLSECLVEIDNRDAVFLLSYADSTEGRRLAGEWYKKTIVTRRHVAGFAGSRRSAREILVSNRPVKADIR